MNSKARAERIRTRYSANLILRFGLAIAASGLLVAGAAPAADAPPAADVSAPTETPAVTSAQPPAMHQMARPRADDRVAVLTRALNLNSDQQLQLSQVLESRREQIRQVWSDNSGPAAYRISATRAIDDRTADQIRALLNDEQKKKYNPSRPPHKLGPGVEEPSVEDWMKATQGPAPASAGH